ncbi:MAG: hypothetical protein OHK0017_01240 [Patescibacteria group bacterium]
MEHHKHLTEYYKRQRLVKSLILVMVVASGFIGLFQPTTVLSAIEAKPDNVCNFGGQSTCLGGTTSFANGGTDTVAKLTIAIVNWLIYIGAALAVFFIVWGGYTMMSANGDDSKVKNGKQTVTYAVIGLVVCLLSYSIVSLVTNFVSSINLANPE